MYNADLTKGSGYSFIYAHVSEYISLETRIETNTDPTPIPNVFKFGRNKQTVTQIIAL